MAFKIYIFRLKQVIFRLKQVDIILLCFVMAIRKPNRNKIALNLSSFCSLSLFIFRPSAPFIRTPCLLSLTGTSDPPNLVPRAFSHGFHAVTMFIRSFNFLNSLVIRIYHATSNAMFLLIGRTNLSMILSTPFAKKCFSIKFPHVL